jgi:hypothetical protein
MLTPARSLWNGRHGRRSSACSDSKPLNVIVHSVSTPPTIAASITPAAISRAAEASGLALDVHAVDTIHAGPFAPVSVATTCSAAPNVCWRRKS